MNSGVRFGPAFVWDNPVGENKSPLKPKEKHLAMNGTKKLLIGLVTVAAVPAFADTKTANTSSGETRLETLFKADLQYRSESQLDAVRFFAPTQYCTRYMVRTRGKGEVNTGTNHVGFRCALAP